MSAVPTTLIARAPEVIRTLPATYLSEVTASRIAAAARAIRHDMLFYSRTPDRMAEVLGQFVDRGGDAASAQAYYAALGEVDEDDVRAVLRHLDTSTAIRVEIPPQKLNVNP